MTAPTLEAERAAPLTDEQISAIYRSTFPRGPYLITADVHKFARAVVAPYAERIGKLERDLELSKKKLGLALKCDREKAERLQDIEQERETPAWAAFADNGNVIIWSRRRDEVERVAIKYSKPVMPVIVYIDGRTAGTVPEGWKLVPIEPTEEMDVAARAECHRMKGVIDPVIHVWDAMIAAAPSPLPPKEEAK